MKDIKFLIQGVITPKFIDHLKNFNKDITPTLWGEYMTKGLPISIYIDWLKEQTKQQESQIIDKYLKKNEIVLLDSSSNEVYQNDEITNLLEEINEKLNDETNNLQQINNLIEKLQHLLENI